MLISCKCLNFIAASNNQRQKQQPTQPQHVSVQTEQQQQQPAASTAAVATADLKENSGVTVAAVALQPSSSDCSNTLVATSSNNNNNIIANSSKGDHNETFSLANALRQAFLQKYPRNFIFYSQCVDFFKQVNNRNIKIIYFNSCHCHFIENILIFIYTPLSKNI